MAAAVSATMDDALDLPDGYQIVWTAIDTSGNAVANVVVNNVSIFGTNLGEGTVSGGGPLGPFMLVPGPGA